MQTSSYGPDFYSEDSEDGFSDDNDYVEFKQKVRRIQTQKTQKVDVESERKKLLKSVFSAITYSKVTVFEEFDKGLDINVDLYQGWTPLLLAATTANVNIFTGIIERNADINQMRDGGITPLMYLCSITSTDDNTEKDIIACVKLLIDKEANLDAIDNKRRTAIMLAAYHGHFEAVNLLLPVVNKDAIDNQGWNILFWAVDGNQWKIVNLLLSLGFNSADTDVRGHTPVDIALANGLEDILDLFPKDPIDELCSYLHTHNLNFDDIYYSLQKKQKPQFFSDICKILYGVRSHCLIPLFKDKNVTLEEFLSLTESKLIDIGVEFPFQRARILNGLYLFHKHPFRPQSIPVVKKDEIYTNMDISTAVVTCLKQILAMEASIKFIIKNKPQALSLHQKKEINILIAKTRQRIKKLKFVVRLLEKRTEQWDGELKPADRITKLRRNIPWCNMCLTVGVISVFLIYKFK